MAIETGTPPPTFGVGINTANSCNLSCKMCPFHSKGSPVKKGFSTVERVNRFINQLPVNPNGSNNLCFASLGEFLMDPNAADYVRLSSNRGFVPSLITNGLLLKQKKVHELLDAGMRKFNISVDAINAKEYEEVRIGGDFLKLLKNIQYLRYLQHTAYPDIQVQVNCILFEFTRERAKKIHDFWKGKTDVLSLRAEYYDKLKWRELFFNPTERVDCELSVVLLPSGQMSPCCAVTVLQHYENMDWLPNIDNTTPVQAYELFDQMYHDPSSPLRSICQKCEWWAMFVKKNGRSPYQLYFQFTRNNAPREKTLVPA